MCICTLLIEVCTLLIIQYNTVRLLVSHQPLASLLCTTCAYIILCVNGYMSWEIVNVTMGDSWIPFRNICNRVLISVPSGPNLVWCASVLLNNWGALCIIIMVWPCETNLGWESNYIKMYFKIFHEFVLTFWLLHYTICICIII